MAIRVLLVDDDSELCDEVVGALEGLGYAVVCVHSGEDAIKTISKTEVDVVLMDMKMPGMGGLEAFNEIKKVRPGLPIIMITGALPSDVVKEFKQTGLASIIYKPFDMDQLINGIETLAGGENNSEK